MPLLLAKFREALIRVFFGWRWRVASVLGPPPETREGHARPALADLAGPPSPAGTNKAGSANKASGRPPPWACPWPPPLFQNSNHNHLGSPSRLSHFFAQRHPPLCVPNTAAPEQAQGTRLYLFNINTVQVQVATYSTGRRWRFLVHK